MAGVVMAWADTYLGYVLAAPLASMALISAHLWWRYRDRDWLTFAGLFGAVSAVLVWVQRWP